MLKIKQHLAVLAIILTLSFVVTCSDIENELAKDFTTSTSNAMFNLTLSVENNITDTNTPVLFTITASRLDTYQIRQDAQMIGFWTLAEQQINGDVQNISQYPMDIEFFEDNSYSKQVPNTVSGETDYFGGSWNFNEDDHTLTLLSGGDTTVINSTFDHPAPVVPLNGYMMWAYTDDGNNFNEVYQKTAEPENYFEEPYTYLYLEASGGDITGTTYPDFTEIEAIIDNILDAKFVVTGIFEPGLDFEQGNIAVSLYNENYGTIVVNMGITINFTD